MAIPGNPATRNEFYLAKAAGGSNSVPEKPETRKEMFLAKMAGQNATPPDPITREEMYLKAASENMGGKLLPRKEINFIDFDGKVVHSFLREEIGRLKELPKLPTRPGLTATGWTKTLQEVKEAAENGNNVDVGATYETDDGKTRIYITLYEGRHNPSLGICINGTATIDWGDGSEPSVVTGTSLTTAIYTPSPYTGPGSYVISISVDGEMRFASDGSSCSRMLIVDRAGATTSTAHTVYLTAIKKIEMGSGVSEISDYAFALLYCLESITIPEGIKKIGKGAFWSCYSLKTVSVPFGVTGIGNEAFYGCTGLMSISLPNGLTSFGVRSFCNCYSLINFTMPDTVSSTANNYLCENCRSLATVHISEGRSSIQSNEYASCYSLQEITIHQKITSIGNSAFSSCFGLGKVRFMSPTPPTLGNSGVFSGVPSDCIFEVPRGSLEAYTAAQYYPNPSTYTYVEFDPE